MMEKIQGILIKHSKNNAIVLLIFMIPLTCIISSFLAEMSALSIISSLLLTGFSVPVLLPMFSTAKGFGDITKNKVWKELMNREYADEFIFSIDSELRDNFRLEYKEKNNGLHLIITKEWFILISNVMSTIRKTEEVERMYENRRKDELVIKFTDGSYLSGDCCFNRPDFIRMCNKAMPNFTRQREDGKQSWI